MCESENAVDAASGASSDDVDEPCEACSGSTDFTVALVTPGLDPVNSPNSTPGDADQNEYTFSTDTPGVLTMTLRAAVTPAGKVGEAQPRVSFEVDAIGGSTLTWDGAGDGSATTIAGDKVEAVATFTGLPANNSDFGTKTVKLKLDGAVVDTRTCEVFFPRDEKNHPNPGQGTTPNWFFYWLQLVGVANVNYAGASGSGKSGEVRGITQWSYTSAPDKTGIYVYDEAVTLSPYTSYGVGITVSGIDSFVQRAVHENQHIQQIARADPLVPSVACWQYGYSWNQGNDNHWGPGPDGKYGPAPGVAAAAVSATPPFVAGLGDDVSIDRSNHWPTAFGAPPAAPYNTIHPIEGEAVKAADAAVSADHTHAREDWGDPGKNHDTVDRWDD